MPLILCPRIELGVFNNIISSTHSTFPFSPSAGSLHCSSQGRASPAGGGIDWFEVECLSVYAPDLNPVEMVWNHTKYADLANFIPENLQHLEQVVTTSITGTRELSWLKQAIFADAGLKL